MKILNDVDMSGYTSFKTGGKALKLAIAESREELKGLLDELTLNDEKYLLLGNGSNTLFALDEYPGTVIKLGEAFDYIKVEGNEIEVGGGTLLSRLAKEAAKAGLTGLEFAGGIPGSVGGAVFMNAGAYDGEIKDTLVKISTLIKKEDGSWEIKDSPAEGLNLSYRHSRIQETGEIVLSAYFKLNPGDKEEILDRMRELNEKRSSKQPLEYPSAGSFFKRPEGYFAGKLIEDAGLKGFSIGDAMVSDKHSGFIINKGDATWRNILDLMERVQTEVQDKFDVKLEPEVRIIR